MASSNQVSDITNWGGSLEGLQGNKPRNYAAAHENLMDEYFRVPTEYRSDESAYLGPLCTEDRVRAPLS